MEAVLFSESGVGGRAVETDAENFGIGVRDAARVDARLDSTHLLGAAFRKGEDVDSEKDVFLAAVITELDGFPIVGEESEVGSEVADLEGSPCNLGFVNLMRQGRRGNCDGQNKPNCEGAFHADSPIEPEARGEPLTTLRLAWLDHQKEAKIPEIERRWRAAIPTAGATG